MRWLTMLTAAIALIGLPLTGSAQEHPTDHAAAPPRDGEAPVARVDHATGGHGIASMSAMSCPMMAQPGMGMAPMRRMSAGRSEDSGMGRGMSAEAHGMGRPPEGMMEMVMPMPGPDADPKTRARWMLMRGEMMKAMGDILLRHGHELGSGR